MAETRVPVETMEVRDPETLRAIAHPVRQRILMQLAVVGHGRAADLAKAIDQPANSVSFHLRVLAKAGMIVEAPEHARDKRDRVWTNVATSYNVKPGAGGAADLILRPTIDWLSEVFAHGDHEETRDAGRTFMLTTMLLTRGEANELVHELSELLNRWSERSLAAARDDAGDGREVYQLLTAVAPRDDPRGDAAGPAKD
ncbi:helix-turn-helix domain-containing protein [Isoptericola sp. 4D.3]|uniref:Helix-turn-helix domain-containing protein n=1 Tax=Isoptericola peretonis TaxID=2918523 RepID=A0ABT0IZ30_9MICO|nr:helix-turn-helix domain-containing protein [Isoptericola sp. 4D.3]